jgi:hypothetical protein
MCRTKSGMVNRLGDVVTSEYTDSHTVIKTSISIADTGSALETANWTPAEFLPPEDLSTIENMATWKLIVDDAVSKPVWWDEMDPTIRANFERTVERMFVRGEHRLLLGGDWILLPGSRVHQAVGARIRIACNGADLYSANLSSADLSGADLSGADLSRANLYSADLSSADLSGADLYSANLSRANLSRANLYSANLSGADLSGADLSRANLYSARIHMFDPVPAGWVRNADTGLLSRAP